jgi:uncharacterized RDD family membrane protein YckC
MKASFLLRAVAVLVDSLLFAILSFMTAGLGFFAWILYEVCLLTLWNGQTIGKKAVGIKVQGVQGDWGKAIVRSLMKIVSGVPFGLGYLWMLWDKDGQTWHDKVAGTTVVKE